VFIAEDVTPCQAAPLCDIHPDESSKANNTRKTNVFFIDKTPWKKIGLGQQLKPLL
jgi:hypothetical protein